MYYLLGLIIPILSYFFQSYPRLFNKYFGVDVWSRLIEADYFRKNHHLPPLKKISDGFILDGYLNYPPALPCLLSYIPKKTLLKIQGLIAPIFDVIQNYLVFLITMQLTNKLEAAILAQIIYASIPLIILENSYLTPRSMGYLLFTLAFYLILLYSLAPKPIYLIACLFFLTILFFTHKFALQAYFFISIFFSVMEKKAFYIFIFFVGMGIAITASRGYYLRILGGHIDNILFWFKNYKYRFAHQIRELVPPKQTDLVGKIYKLLGVFTPITLVGTNLWIIIPLGLLMINFFNIPILSTSPYSLSDPLIIKISIWVVFFYIFSILVLIIKLLIPIGEGQRYMEMATAPAAIIAAITFFVLSQSQYKNIVIPGYALILTINIALATLLQIKGIIWDKNRSLTKDMQKVFDFINKIKPKPRVLCIPHQITTMVLYNTKAKVMVEIQAGHLARVDDIFPVLKKSIPELAKKYNLNFLVLKKDYATMEELKLSKRNLLLETETTQVFKI